MAQAVMHTSGQAYAMAFQAGGPHAQDRALEAIAYAYAEMTRHASQATWEKPQGKRPPQRMTKTFTVVPRGVALVIGCNTFPTWNSYPGLFASLVTGNAVVVKPHPGAVLPLAITVAIARDVLAGAGFSPDLVQLAAEQPGEGLAKVLALRPEVKVIDYTGSTGFGTWLEQNAHQASVFTEKAGVNTVVIDSTDDYPGMLANLAFSLSLYSGQMCTTPQNLLVPRDGITADGAPKSVDELAADLAAAVDGLLGDDARATALLGAVVNPGVLERLEKAPSYGDVVLASRTVTHPDFPDAVVRTPTVVKVDVADRDTYLQECFGPVSFLVTTGSTAESIDLLRESVRDHGAITAAVYSTDDKVLDATEEAALDAGVALSENLTETVYVNQSAAFSDFHATGANPAANSALTDAAYVASRFRIVQSRRHLPA
jgi:phenylacetic acid degradation protein paaN